MNVWDLTNDLYMSSSEEGCSESPCITTFVQRAVVRWASTFSGINYLQVVI